MNYKNFSQTTVAFCREIKRNSGIFLLKLWWERPDFKPGQFIMLEPINKSSGTPRPFSVFTTDSFSISLVIKVVGENTKLYSQLRKGDKIKTCGPLGKPIPLEAEDKNYILVGGGMGAASLLLLAKKLVWQDDKSVKVLLGGKDSSQIVGKKLFRECGCAVESVTEKEGKLVTHLLENHLRFNEGKSVVVACGPKPMLKKISELCEKHSNKCWVLLEQIMACGIGSCKGCDIPLKYGSYESVCLDGPAFKASRINWDELVPPKITIESFPKKSRKKINPIETVLRGKTRSIVLKCPTLTASGCFEMNTVQYGPTNGEFIGAYILKGLTLHGSQGNRSPRICETPSGMLNSIGLKNIGLAEFLKQLPSWKKGGKILIPNIAGKTVEEFVQIAVALWEAGIDIAEINVSCPNDKRHRKIFALHADMVYEVLSKVREAVKEMFLITKLSPKAQYIIEPAEAAVKGGTDALSIGNTYPGMSIDPWTLRPRIGSNIGGLSGPAIRPINVLKVHEVYRAGLGVPIIGIGGIHNASSAMEFILAGANAIACGTGSFKNPDVFKEICEGLKKFIEYHGVGNIQELVGKVVLY